MIGYYTGVRQGRSASIGGRRQSAAMETEESLFRIRGQSRSSSADLRVRSPGERQYADLKVNSTPANAVALEKRTNEPGMSLKTKDEVRKSSLVAQTADSAVCGFSMFVGTDRGPQTRRSAPHQNRRKVRRNKARMSMKTTSRGVWLRRPPTLRSAAFPCSLGQTADRKHGGPRYTKIGGTKRECL